MKKQVLRIISVVLAVSLLSGMFYCACVAAEDANITDNSVVTKDKDKRCCNRVEVSDYYNNNIREYDGLLCVSWGGNISKQWVLGYRGSRTIVEIPEEIIEDIPVSLVALSNFPKNTVFDKIVIPSTVSSIYSFIPSEEEGDFYCKFYECDENNKFYRSVDGVLYTKDMKTLILYPNACENKEFVLPDSVETVYDYAFSNCKYLEKITLNRNVKIGTGAFFNCNNLKFVKKHPVYPSYYWRGCFYGCDSVRGPFGLLIKAENKDLPEGWENTTAIESVCLNVGGPGIHGVLNVTSKLLNKVTEKFTDRFKNRFSSSESSSVISSEDSSSSLFVEICIAVIKIIEVFLPGLN